MYALAHHFEIRTSTVSGILRRSGIPIREQRTFGDTDLQAAAEHYEQGLSLAKVGDRLGFDTETIRKHLRRNGVQIRPRPGRPYYLIYQSRMLRELSQQRLNHPVQVGLGR